VVIILVAILLLSIDGHYLSAYSIINYWWSLFWWLFYLWLVVVIGAYSILLMAIGGYCINGY